MYMIVAKQNLHVFEIKYDNFVVEFLSIILNQFFQVDLTKIFIYI